MSAAEALRAGVAAAIEGIGVPVFDAAPDRGALPHAVVGEPVLGDWSAVGVTGREGRIAVTLADRGERPVRLRVLAGEVDDRLATMMPELSGGWRLVGMRLARCQVVRGREHWTATVEMRVRMWRVQ